MSTATPDPDKSLKPGEVKPDLIPHDWPLTPLQGKKAYILAGQKILHTSRD